MPVNNPTCEPMQVEPSDILTIISYRRANQNHRGAVVIDMSQLGVAAVAFSKVLSEIAIMKAMESAVTIRQKGE